MNIILIENIDCGIPSTTGYVYTSTDVTTYGATTPVECAEGFGDAASPSSVSCEATGNWGTVSGCTVKGKTWFQLSKILSVNCNY